ncbi:hypothetical protein F5B22DRAFT_655908 [Xylaria bambusicola]|uniref:uncharacterized protein n=1 Tax=Xylaria bambusicola TaxID=326684 RepID=UPI00200768E9|nr:uncharacterized protein F5B22DRAFT_655908 [Xylaria bambusicola]KAI0516726.1 hypothetical protein F5B22DRAFT_655908 [Xylaria bambusicola]
MLSLSSLLNPAPPGSSNDDEFFPSPIFSSPTDSCAEESLFPNRSTMPKHKMPKDAAVFTKGKPKGAINFHPHEDLDEASLRRTRLFQVYPLGKIREFSRHIPYNSGKKDFFDKTGRESFEVFQYVFKVPGDDTEYTVMWDYNVGLVRMTPFFKCCKYPKTTPAKMLNSNPGLKEITHSITGGSIMAQGYWMPYQCARAVCATFCHNISGALIPIFGPDFPALCTQVDAPEYSRMVIDPAIVMQSTREAEYYRHLYSNTTNVGSASKNDNGNRPSPKRDLRVHRPYYDGGERQQHRHRVRKPGISTPRSDNSTYTTDTEGEISPIVERTSLVSDLPHYQHPRSLHSPTTALIPSLRESHAGSSSSGWTPANILHAPTHLRQSSEYQASGPNPWLSAIPRFTTASHIQTVTYPSANASRSTRFQPYPGTQPSSQPQPHPQTYHHHTNTARGQLPSPLDIPPKLNTTSPSSRTKRPASQIEDHRDHRHDASQSQVVQHYRTNKSSHVENRSIRVTEDDKATGADKKAALLLMNLSVRESSSWQAGRKPQNANEGGRFEVDSRYAGDDGRYQDKAHYTEKDSGNARGSRYNGGAAKVGSDGISNTEVVPRTKRLRSNSM